MSLEKHYTVEQVARAWAVSPQTIRRRFQDLPGVLRIPGPSIARKRQRTWAMLRIPESVVQQVHAEGTKGWTR